MNLMTKMTSRPLRAPLAYFEASLSLESRNEDMEELTGNQSDEEVEDGRVRNTEAVNKIRNAWIYAQMNARAEEFTQYRNVSYFCSFECIFVNV